MTWPVGRSNGLGLDRVLLCRDSARLALSRDRHSLAREGNVSVAIENSLLRQGIAASCRYSEGGFVTGVGHDRAGPAKLSVRYLAHGRRPENARPGLGEREGVTGDFCSIEALSRQTTHAALSRQN